MLVTERKISIIWKHNTSSPVAAIILSKASVFSLLGETKKQNDSSATCFHIILWLWFGLTIVIVKFGCSQSLLRLLKDLGHIAYFSLSNLVQRWPHAQFVKVLYECNFSARQNCHQSWTLFVCSPNLVTTTV